jgi:RNA polymerase sigma-70 factor (ECF subfamily)
MSSWLSRRPGPSRALLRLRQPADGEGTLSDEAIAAACSSGDPVAVAALYDRFHARVGRFLYRVAGARADCEDLLQATFLEVARGKARFDGRSAVLTWVLGIAANVARHHLRSTSRRDRLRVALRLAAATSPVEDPAAAVEARQSLEQAWRMLAALPAERRLAFVLCEIEGLSARQAAEALGTSETAVWKRVSAARQAIRAAASGGDR